MSNEVKLFVVRTWVSRRIMRSEDILGSIPIEQCLAIALVSSDCMVKGGNIPVEIKVLKYRVKKEKKLTMKQGHQK